MIKAPLRARRLQFQREFHLRHFLVSMSTEPELLHTFGMFSINHSSSQPVPELSPGAGVDMKHEEVTMGSAKTASINCKMHTTIHGHNISDCAKGNSMVLVASVKIFSIVSTLNYLYVVPGPDASPVTLSELDICSFYLRDKNLLIGRYDWVSMHDKQFCIYCPT